MTKQDYVNFVAEKAGITKVQAEKAVNAFVESLGHSIVSEERVFLNGLGVFQVKTRSKRVGRNPKTGDTIEIPPKKTIVFKPTKHLKEQINNKK